MANRGAYQPPGGFRIAVLFLIVALMILRPEVSQADVGISWNGPDGNSPMNWNFSSQRYINQTNAASLSVQWTFPVPPAPTSDAGAEGAMVTPLVVGGVLYTVTNWNRVMALNAGNGQVIWFRDLPIESNYSSQVAPSIPGPLGVPLGHYHAIFYTSRIEEEPLIWILTNSYQIFALKALTGDIQMRLDPLRSMISLGIPGNYGEYDADTPSMVIDEQRGILVFGPSVSEGSSGGRGFLAAWNVSAMPPRFLWRSFIIPPQDGSDPKWSIKSVENSTHAYIFNGTSAIDLKSLPQAKLDDMLRNDWGTFGFNGTRSFAGDSTGWGGSWAIDSSTGVAYVGTSTPTPDWNATFRPGPDLWSNSVLAINESNGKLVWGFQTEAHALGDYDCSWNVLLANVSVSGDQQKVVYKGCKNGYIFALNAQTGRMLWYLRPPSIKTMNSRVLDPENKTQMRLFNWPAYPQKGPVVQNPSDTGSLESDLAYDPTTATLYAAPYNEPKLFGLTDVPPLPGGSVNTTVWQFSWGVNVLTIRPVGPVNTTIYALDAAKGNVKWSYFIAGLPYRGGLTVSGGVLYVSTLDGTLRMLDSTSGGLIASRNIGGSLLSQPSIGADVSGRPVLFLTDMGSSRWGPAFPGFIQALGLNSSVEPNQTWETFSPFLYVAVGALVGASAVYLLHRLTRPVVRK